MIAVQGAQSVLVGPGEGWIAELCWDCQEESVGAAEGRQGGGSGLAVDGPQVALSDLLVATRLPQGPLPLLPQLELLPSAPCRAQPQ